MKQVEAAKEPVIHNKEYSRSKKLDSGLGPKTVCTAIGNAIKGVMTHVSRFVTKINRRSQDSRLNKIVITTIPCDRKII